MKTLRKLILLFLVLSFYGCDYFCRDMYINLAFVGFDSTDIDTIILRQYQPNNRFENPIDTFLITRNNRPYIFTTINDTTIIYANNGNDSAHVTNGYDWDVYVPAKNKTVHISNIVRAPGTGKHGCLNPIISFKQDSLIIAPTWISTEQFWTKGYRAYIYK
jgi:hypothetical protein